MKKLNYLHFHSKYDVKMNKRRSMRKVEFLILNPQAELSEAIKAGLLVICRTKFPPRKIASFKDFLKKSDGTSYLYFYLFRRKPVFDEGL